MTRPRVLLVWADPELAAAARDALTAAGYAARWERDSLAGLIAVEEWRPAVVALDWDLRFVQGEIFVGVLHAGLATPPLVIALHEGEVTGFALPAGVAAALPMPPEPTALVETVARLLADDTARPT